MVEFNWVTCLVLLVCGMIFWQDVKERAVYWFLFPILFVLGMIHSNSLSLWKEWLVSMVLVFSLITLLTLYLSLRNGKWINISAGFFSWGDILFLVAAIPFFFSINYLYYFTFGTLGALLIHLVTRTISKEKTIPYAGYMAMFLAFILIVGWNHQPIFFAMNEWK